MRSRDWSTRRLILVIWNGSVFGARVRGRKMEGVIEASFEEEDQLEPAVDAVVRGLAAGKRMRASVTVAVGPAHYHLKRVPGGLVHNHESALELDGLVARFAVVESRDEWIASLHEYSGECAWLFLVKRRLTETIERAVRPMRCTVQHVVPIAAALAAVDGDGDAIISERGHVVRYTAHAGRLITHRRARSRGQATVSESQRLGVPDAIERESLLCAIDAVDARDVPSLSARQLGGGVASAASRTSRRAALLVLAACSLWTVVAPIAVPLVKARRLEAELQRLSPHAQRVVPSRQALERTTQQLAVRSNFRSTAPAIELLAAIADRLPEGIAISSWRLDSNTTTIVLLGPQAAGSLVSLGEVNGLRNGRIEGGVSRESLKGAAVERATLVFDVVHTRPAVAAELSRRRGM